MNKADKEEFINKNFGMIKKEAGRFYFNTPKFSFEDLIQVGSQAAVRALDSYDPNRGEAKIETYVYRSISNSIRNFVGKNRFDLYYSQNEQKKHWEARREGKSNSDFAGIHNPQALRLDSEITEESLNNILPSGEPPPDQQMVVDEQREILMGEVAKLSSKEQKVIIGRYFDNLSFRELGQQLGITRQGASLVEKRAFKKLKERLSSKLETIDRADGAIRLNKELL